MTDISSDKGPIMTGEGRAHTYFSKFLRVNTYLYFKEEKRAD